MPVARRFSSYEPSGQDLERDWARGSTLRAPLRRPFATPAQTSLISIGRRMTPEWQRTLVDVVARTRALFDAGRPVADGVAWAPALGTPCDLACGRSRPGPDSRPAASTSFARGRRLTAATRCRSLACRHLAPTAVTRKTSFYYSFLVLPARQSGGPSRLVFDVCRAIDDSVDLEPDP